MKTSSKIIMGWIAILFLFTAVITAICLTKFHRHESSIEQLTAQIESGTIRVVDIVGCDPNNVHISNGNSAKYLHFYTIIDSVFFRGDTLHVRNQPSGLAAHLPNTLESVLVNGKSLDFQQQDVLPDDLPMGD